MDDLLALFPQYRPDKDVILYHYCPAESFKAIIENKTLRFCDLYHMNDMAELSHGNLLFETLLKEAEMPEDIKDIIRNIHKELRDRIVMLSMSFSKDGDQLSQWRGYANDGKGFCIGFNACELDNLPVNILKVEYDVEKQCALIWDAIGKIIDKIRDGLTEKNLLFIAELIELFALMKNESFAEEKEYRLVSPLGIDMDKGTGVFNDFIHSDKYNNFFCGDIAFRLVDNIPVPYVDIYYNRDNRKPIVEVIIGPKNMSTEFDIDLFLRTNNIYDVKISKSLSSYR